MAIKNCRLMVFNNLTLDGYFTTTKADRNWPDPNKVNGEWNQFIEDNASHEFVLLFGRITYELMALYWLAEQAKTDHPIIAKRMNNLQKIVFSKTLESVSWANTTLVKSSLAGHVRKMKKERGPDMLILGSGSIVAQLLQQGLTDEFGLVINRVFLGSGRTMFEGIKGMLSLKLIKTRPFENGSVMLCYEPAGDVA